MSNCKRFKELYHQEATPNGCFGNLNVGREYICPNVGPKVDPYPKQELNSWFAKQYHRSSNCHGKLPQIGYNVLCGCPAGHITRQQSQMGGGVGKFNRSAEKLRYSASGEMTTFRCQSCNGTSQNGGGKKSKSRSKCRCGEPMRPSKNYPCSTCSCNPSSECKYIKFDKERQYGNHIREVPGSYFDLAKPAVAKRPVQAENDNSCKYGFIPKEGRKVTNYKGNKFNCTQPFWWKPCM